MAWARNRALLIGAGAVVVVAVAAGVAAAHAGSRHRHRIQLVISRDYLRGPHARGPFGGGARRELGPGWFGTPPGGMGLAPALPRLGALGALHGELTLPAGNGKYQTVDVQRGTVTKVSPGSLTVRSADGFTKTYAATGSLLRAVTKGDLVQLRATVSGTKATVVSLVDLSRMTRSSTGGDYLPPQ